MAVMAQEYLDSFKDVVYEGSLSYFGLLAAALTIGHKLNIAGNGYSTGWESIDVPITAVELQYQERGGATHYVMSLSFTNRRAAYSGAALRRPAMTGQPFGLSESSSLASGVENTTGQVAGAFGQAAELRQHLASSPGPFQAAAAQSAGAGLGNPMTGVGNPMAEASNPMAGLANPMEGMGNPFDSIGNPFGGNT
jgi:hypothetical protein